MKRIVICVILVCLSVSYLHARGLRVAFVGDPQVDNETELEYARKSIYRELRGRTDLDLVIVLGDLVNDNQNLISPSVAILDSLPCPWFAVPGNHDYDVYSDKSRIRDLSTWKKVIGYVDTTFVRGNVRFVLADNVRYGGKGGYSGGFDGRQMEWLDSISRIIPDNRHIVLATHIPVSTCSQKDSVIRMFSGHKEVLFVSGHTHTVARHHLDSLDRVEEMIVGSTCGSWWRGVKDEYGIPYALQNCGAPRGFFITEFSRNAYTHEYCPVSGRDKCSAFVVVAEDGRKKLLTNVFGGHKSGRVSVFIPGYGKLCMTRVSDVACEVLEVISFNKSLSKEERRNRKSDIIPLRNMKSPHLWAVELPDGVEPSEIRICYKDRHMSFDRWMNAAKFNGYQIHGR